MKTLNLDVSDYELQDIRRVIFVINEFLADRGFYAWLEGREIVIRYNELGIRQVW